MSNLNVNILSAGLGVRITSAESPPGESLPPFLPLVAKSPMAGNSDPGQDFWKTSMLEIRDDNAELIIPPLEVVARSKTVAKASPWDSSGAIVTREAPRPEEGVVGGIGGGIGWVGGEVIALDSPEA